MEAKNVPRWKHFGQFTKKENIEEYRQRNYLNFTMNATVIPTMS